MKKVWLVYNHYYDDQCVVGVYTTKQRAEQAVIDANQKAQDSGYTLELHIAAYPIDVNGEIEL